MSGLVQKSPFPHFLGNRTTEISWNHPVFSRYILLATCPYVYTAALTQIEVDGLVL